MINIGKEKLHLFGNLRETFLKNVSYNNINNHKELRRYRLSRKNNFGKKQRESGGGGGEEASQIEPPIVCLVSIYH